MARGFSNATGGLGTANTDYIQTAHSSQLPVFTYHIAVYKTGGSASGYSKYFCQGTGADVCQFYNNIGNSHITLYRNFSGSVGAWDIDASSLLPTSTWHHLGVSYDGTSTSNAPVFYYDNTKPTIIPIATPAGTVTDLSGKTTVIGNELSSTTEFVGAIAEAAIWNVVLTDNEFYALNAGYSPALVRPTALVEYVPMLRDNISRKLAAPTISGALVYPHPRVIYPRREK